MCVRGNPSNSLVISLKTTNVNLMAALEGKVTKVTGVPP